MAEQAQLVFDIAPPPSYAREDYMAGAGNEDALTLATTLSWPTPVGVVSGEPGSGKTHLAHVMASRFSAVAWFDGTVPDISQTGGAIIMDGLERFLNGDQDAIFHTLETARANQWVVFVTLQQPPETLGIKRPDTLSRLRAGERAKIELPDDSLFRAIAVKLFTDRNLMVDPAIADYLLQRMERSYANLTRLVALIDERSLAAGRSITKPFAREVLAAYELSQS